MHYFNPKFQTTKFNWSSECLQEHSALGVTNQDPLKLFQAKHLRFRRGSLSMNETRELFFVFDARFVELMNLKSLAVNGIVYQLECSFFFYETKLEIAKINTIK
jgi:hypothetical protein